MTRFCFASVRRWRSASRLRLAVLPDPHLLWSYSSLYEACVSDSLIPDTYSVLVQVACVDLILSSSAGDADKLNRAHLALLSQQPPHLKHPSYPAIETSAPIPIIISMPLYLSTDCTLSEDFVDFSSWMEAEASNADLAGLLLPLPDILSLAEHALFREAAEFVAREGLNGRVAWRRGAEDSGFGPNIVFVER